MKVQVSAAWAPFKDLGERIEIAGYTAAVEKSNTLVVANEPVFEFTVLQDHLRIVEVGHRTSLVAAKIAAENAIQNDINGGAQ